MSPGIHSDPCKACDDIAQGPPASKEDQGRVQWSAGCGGSSLVLNVGICEVSSVYQFMFSPLTSIIDISNHPRLSDYGNDPLSCRLLRVEVETTARREMGSERYNNAQTVKRQATTKGAALKRRYVL